MEFSEKVRRMAGEKPYRWAAQHRIPKGTMKVWLSGALPQSKSLDRLAQATGIPAHWWRDGEWPPPARASGDEDSNVPPLYLEVGASPAVYASEPVSDYRARQPVGDDRMRMLEVLLATIEIRLLSPMTPEIANRVIDVAQSWSGFAAADASLLERLQAAEAAARLYLECSA